MITTLKLFGKGQITLPKEWRDKMKTENFIAEETTEGLLIKPLNDGMYYEIDDETFGIHFPAGIEASKLLAKLKKAHGKIR